MTTSTFNERNQHVAEIWQDNRWLYLLMGFGLGVLTLPALQLINTNTVELLTGLVPEAVGIVFTVLIIERFARTRADKELKEQLYFQLRSEDNSTALNALSLLKHKGWIQKGSLKGRNLSEANLAGAKLRLFDLSESKLYGSILNGAYLWEVNLSRSELLGADLSSARLGDADLSSANLFGANLSCADLWRTDLSCASLQSANLSDASLRRADLSGADLKGAKLTGADLSNRANISITQLGENKFDETTIMPDASYLGDDSQNNPVYDKSWTPETDVSRYTNPEHPDYWQPHWSASGFNSFDDWWKAGHPEPWLNAGYDDWNEWVRAGKPMSRDESPPDA